MTDPAFSDNPLGETIFKQKYAATPTETWAERAQVVAHDVVRYQVPRDARDEIANLIANMKFIPGGRYLAYAGKPLKSFNNCFLLRSLEDTREDWADISWKAERCLSSGGGIGVDYSIYRPKNSPLKRTGGLASGPVSKMRMINEIGREVMQGGSRRSAIYASLNWQHPDIYDFMTAKNWRDMIVPGTGKSLADIKELDFNWPAPLDMTNISPNYDDAWLEDRMHPTFVSNVFQAMSTGEPGFSFNFGAKQSETLRNACVPFETQILTKYGYVEIGQVVGQDVSIWNGQSFSDVVPFSTGVQELIEVFLSDGSTLVCTKNHEFVVAGDERVRAKDLKVGQKLHKFEMPYVESGVDDPIDAYSQGFYSGDGTTRYKHSWVYAPKYECIPRLIGKVSDSGVSDRRSWVHGEMKPKDWVPLNASGSYCLNWLAGLIDADGTVTHDKNGDGIQLGSIDYGFLDQIRLMLTRLGCRSKIVLGNAAGMRNLPDGKGGLRLYKCQQLYRLLIGNTDTHNLLRNGLTTSRLKLDIDRKPQRDARRFVTVTSVESTGRVEETYCFTEPRFHRGTFNGIVTGQCTEVTSSDDSDVCNLASINLAKIDSLEEFSTTVHLATLFLLCGTMIADLPYPKVNEIRTKNRRLGLGLMGVHEWFVQRGHKYEMNDEFRRWLEVYRLQSDTTSKMWADYLQISRPVANRAIAPTGTIGILAGTTTGIEPVYAVAYKRRYLKNGKDWHYQYVVDGMAKRLIEKYGTDPEKIESAADLAGDPERRIRFQADVQDYVDMAISSTINLPAWGTDANNEDKVEPFARTLAHYAPRLRGFTVYPDGARGGQPLTSVPYSEAVGRQGAEYLEEQHDVCSITGKGGTCGV